MKGKAGSPPEEKLSLEERLAAQERRLAPTVHHQRVEATLPIDQPVSVLTDNYEAAGPIHQAVLDDPSPMIDLEGARYSAKTWTFSAKVIQYCIDYPEMEWLICRYSKEDAIQFLKPVFERVCKRMGHYPIWDEGAFRFENGSFVTIGGLRSQDRLSKQAKVRGRDVGGLWVDQTEEVPREVGEELHFMTRQPGVPHITLISPNPPDEDSWIADFFPEDDSIIGRKFYRVGLYDNKFCPEDKLAELERTYPRTHIKYKKLILGLRGPDVSGDAIYQDTFQRGLHVVPVRYDPDIPLLEAYDIGRHHPTWMLAQRNYYGGFEIIGGIMGKKMFIEDFIPIIEKYREEWCPNAKDIRSCCDPPPQSRSVKSTNIQLLKDAGIKARWKDHANAPDVREAIIQSIASLMRRRLGPRQALSISDNVKHWLMASHVIVKQHQSFINGCEGSYCWDANYVSVGSKKIRQPIINEWVDGSQRCLENLILNFGSQKTRAEIEVESEKGSSDGRWTGRATYKPPSAWT